MELIRSNRTEELADALASRVGAEPLGAFESEAIVVQSRGMERWLTLALATRLGVWSNPSFPFPRSAIEQVLDNLALGPSEQSRAYDPAQMKWTIAELLHEDAPPELRKYLGDTVDPDRVLRLATTLSTMFDQYVVYRPRLVESWVHGADTQWQAELWRRIASKLGPHDLTSRIGRALTQLRSPNGPGKVDYKRLHLFSLETLPPLLLEFCATLSRWVPTNLYLLTPTTEYVSNVDKSGQLSLAIGPSVEEGHPLLMTLGNLARDFQELMLDADSSVVGDEERFAETNRATLLHSLQADILEFRSPPEATERVTIATSDDSISVHACTSPMREVLVLHDIVRAALEDDPSLRPEDIVVMTPDLEAYAPAFRAVFGQHEAARIPYEVHDRRTRDDSVFYDDFLAVLEVLESRFSVLDVVRLIDAQSLREEFRFSSTERARITDLLEAAGIRWGIDADHRADLGFPAESLHTWRAGFGRLFLGFTSMPETGQVFQNLVPRGDPSLGDAELVARLSRLCTVLFDFHARAQKPTLVATWAELLGELSGALFDEEDEDSGAVRVLRSSLDGLRSLVEVGGYRRPVSLRSIRREIAGLVLRGTPAAGFLKRGVTLSELVPLRSVPFRMVCLIGMSEESFPRADDRPSFDLMRARPLLGDRNKRSDDRHSFLQAILCARDRLAMMYNAPATSARSTPSPSAVIAGLAETLDRYYTRDGSASVLVPIAHPLHAFDQTYFTEESAFWSFSERHLRIAHAMAQPAIEPGRLELRAEPDPVDDVLSIRSLTQWIWHPTREFIQKRLRTRFGDPGLYEPARALTTLGPLEAFRVGNEALEASLRGDELRTFLRAAPEFPDGSWGEVNRDKLAREIEAVLARREEATGGGTESVRMVSVEIGGVILEGRIDGLIGDRRIKHRFNKTGTKTEVTTWLEHLLMQAAHDPTLPRATQLVLRATDSRADVVTLGAVDDARALLGELVQLYQMSQTSPVPLLNRSSLTYADHVFRERAGAALAKARKQQEDDQRWDQYARFAWGKAGPFSDDAWSKEFEATSLRVYEPFFRHRRLG